MDAVEKGHRIGVTLLEPAAGRRGLQRKTHLDIGRREFAAGYLGQVDPDSERADPARDGDVSVVAPI